MSLLGIYRRHCIVFTDNETILLILMEQLGKAVYLGLGHKMSLVPPLFIEAVMYLCASGIPTIFLVNLVNGLFIYYFTFIVW